MMRAVVAILLSCVFMVGLAMAQEWSAPITYVSDVQINMKDINFYAFPAGSYTAYITAELDSISYTLLADEGNYTVYLEVADYAGNIANATWTFEVRQMDIEMAVFDADGDDHWEVGESITVNWEAFGGTANITVYLNEQEVGIDGITVGKNGTFTFIPSEPGTCTIVGTINGIEICNVSFTVYSNDYMIYIVKNESVTVWGLNVTRTAIVDFENTSIANITVYGAKPVKVSMNSFTRSIAVQPIEDAIVYIDSKANTIMQPSSVAPMVWFCNNKSEFNFMIQAPGKEGSVVMFKVKDENVTEVLDDLVYNQTPSGIEISDIEEKVSRIYIFGSEGIVIADVVDSEIQEITVYGSVPPISPNVSQILDNLAVLLDNFTPNYYGYYDYFVNNEMGSGVYILDAITKDRDVVGVVARTMIVIVDGEYVEIPNTITVGDNITINVNADKVYALLLKSDYYNVTHNLVTSEDALETQSLVLSL